MIQVVEELLEGLTINLPLGKATWTIYMLGFVDDKQYYVNNLQRIILKHLLEALEKPIRTWDELLTFVSGQLEMEKNAWYLKEWDYDTKDYLYIKEQSQPIKFIDAKGKKIPSKNSTERNINIPWGTFTS